MWPASSVPLWRQVSCCTCSVNFWLLASFETASEWVPFQLVEKAFSTSWQADEKGCPKLFSSGDRRTKVLRARNNGKHTNTGTVRRRAGACVWYGLPMLPTFTAPYRVRSGAFIDSLRCAQGAPARENLFRKSVPGASAFPLAGTAGQRLPLRSRPQSSPAGWHTRL